MASTFLKDNFKSMKMTDEEKEMEFLNKSIPKNLSSLNAMKKLLEEELN